MLHRVPSLSSRRSAAIIGRGFYNNHHQDKYDQRIESQGTPFSRGSITERSNQRSLSQLSFRQRSRPQSRVRFDYPQTDRPPSRLH